jgi:predicted 2-oxoglutarate/Fe(II)-dependent dioxygenase YbiX
MLNRSLDVTKIDQCRPDDLAQMIDLYERLEQVLTQRLNKHKPDCRILWQLGNCKRKLGKLEEAVDLLKKASSMEPGNYSYAYAVAALGGSLNLVLPQPEGASPGPLVMLKSFLPLQVVSDTLEYMHKNQAEFTPALVGQADGQSYAPQIRNNQDLKGKHPIKEIIRCQIRENLQPVCQRLGMSLFKPSMIEVKLRIYRQGEYFRIHNDSGRGRKISFVYFLFPQPKRFTGGDLVVFDTDPEASTYTDDFTRIVPQNNTLCLFPSHYFHAALPVKTQDSNFLSARFAINGHIRI